MKGTLKIPGLLLVHQETGLDILPIQHDNLNNGLEILISSIGY